MKMKRIFLMCLASISLLPVNILSAEVVSSPDGQIKVTIDDTGGKLTYAATWGDKVIVSTSEFSILEGQTATLSSQGPGNAPQCCDRRGFT